MVDIEALKQERIHKLKCCEDILKKAEDEDRQLNAEEKKSTEQLLREAKEIEDQLEEIAEAERRADEIRAAVAELKKPQERKVSDPEPRTKPKTTSKEIEVVDQFRYSKMRAFKGKDAEVRAYKAGQWALAAIYGNYRAKRWCAEHGIEVRALSEGINTAGGVLVPTELEQAIIDLRETYGIFRQNTRILPMGSDNIIVPRRTGGLTAYFTDENTAFTESDKAWDNVQLVAKKCGVMTRMSSELAEDAVINLADDLAYEIGYAFAYKEDLCGFNGDGTATYGSIVGVTVKIMDGNHDGSVVTAATDHDTFSEIDAADLALLMSSCPQYARPGASWYCSQTCADLVFGRLMAAGGGNTMGDLAGAPRLTYLGYPIVVSQVLPAGATTDYSSKLMLMFGDLTLASTMGVRRGVRISLTDQRYWAEDQIAIKGSERFDINVHDVGDGTTAGPVVALKGH